MSELKIRNDNKTIIIAAAVVAVIFVAGALIYMNQQKKQTVSLNIGGKQISATFDK